MAESSTQRDIPRGPAKRVDGLAAPRPEVLASITDQHVLRVIGDSPTAVSRAEIAEATGLSKPAVSAAAARLLERGVLRDVGVREGRRGGVATLFEIDPNHGRSMAVVIQDDAITVQTRDLHGVVRAELEAAVSSASRRDELILLVNGLIAEAQQTFPAPLLAATVSIADPVDAKLGVPLVLERSVFPAVPLDPRATFDLSDAVQVVIDNDVNWATLGEFREGALHGCENFVYIHFGRGIGGGMLLDGRLYRGHRGLAGEVGYLRDGGSEHRDITERLAAAGLGTAGQYGLDLRMATEHLSRTPLTSVALEAADVLALAIANVAIAVNPQAVAFGGPLSTFPAFTEALRERIARVSIDTPELVVSTSTPLLGAGLEAHRLALQEAGLPQPTESPAR